MGFVMIRCPRTGREIPTGIEMSRSEFERAPVFFARADCPICASVHEWFAQEAWVCEILPPAARMTDRSSARAPLEQRKSAAGGLLSGGGGKPSGAGTVDGSDRVLIQTTLSADCS
jgi:hypothetical protein